jgi:hypothetical protein
MAMGSVAFGQIQWEWHKKVSNDRINYNIVFTNGRFFALGSGHYITTSVDGISWDSIFVGPDVGYQKSIIYGHAGYVLACDGGSIWTSENGIDWTKRYSLSGQDGYSLSATYGNNLYLVSGYSNPGTGRAWILTSSDAIAWSKLNLDTTLCCFTQVIYINPKFIAVGADLLIRGLTMVSSDGLNWTNMTPVSERLPYELWSVAFGNNRLVALGQNGGCLISSDGVSWSRGDTSLKDDFHSIAYGNGYFVGIGENRIFRSPDGIKWAKDTIMKNGQMYSIAYGNNRFVAMGQSDSVLISLAPNVPAHRVAFAPIPHSPMIICIKNDVLHLALPSTAIGKSELLTCYDATGSEVFSMRSAPSAASLTCDVKHLSPGWYMLSLSGKNASERKPFLITR